jgi:hypothetical protein
MPVFLRTRAHQAWRSSRAGRRCAAPSVALTPIHPTRPHPSFPPQNGRAPNITGVLKHLQDTYGRPTFAKAATARSELLARLEEVSWEVGVGMGKVDKVAPYVRRTHQSAPSFSPHARPVRCTCLPHLRTEDRTQPHPATPPSIAANCRRSRVLRPSHASIRPGPALPGRADGGGGGRGPHDAPGVQAAREAGAEKGARGGKWVTRFSALTTPKCAPPPHTHLHSPHTCTNTAHTAVRAHHWNAGFG